MANVNAPAETRASYGSVSSWINLLLGIWLFLSAFIWQHSMSAQTDTWIVGLLIVLVSAIAMTTPSVRYVNTLLAIWLFFSTIGFAHGDPPTIWNNVIVAIVVFLLSLVPVHSTTGMTVGGGPVHAT